MMANAPFSFVSCKISRPRAIESYFLTFVDCAVIFNFCEAISFFLARIDSVINHFLPSAGLLSRSINTPGPCVTYGHPN
jgi:hypothetical protein